MTHRGYGIFSILILIGAWLAALIVIIVRAPVWGIVYALVLILSGAAVLYFYCARCPAKKVCPYVIPCKVAALMPGRMVSSYSVWETGAFILGTGVPIVFPVALLWPHRLELSMYILLILLAAIGIRFKVCPDCKNVYCFMKPRKNS